MALSKVRRVVLLGTGTGVGKSFVIRALADALVRRCPSSKVLALKPVETGRASDSSFEDARSLEAVSRPAPQKPHPLYGLTDPVSPHLAAQRDGVHIEI